MRVEERMAACGTLGKVRPNWENWMLFYISTCRAMEVPELY